MRVRVVRPSSVPERLIRAVWAPSLIRRLLRHRLVWATAAVMVALVTSMALSARARAVEAARAGWGTTTTVVIVDAPVAVGEPLEGHVSEHEIPVAMVPDGAVATVPATGRAKVALFPGEILMQQRVASTRSSGIPDATVALTMPVLTQVPLLGIGDLVDIWVIDPATGTTSRAASAVVVLAFTDDEVTVAVPEAEADVATVAALRPVAITLIG